MTVPKLTLTERVLMTIWCIVLAVVITVAGWIIFEVIWVSAGHPFWQIPLPSSSSPKPVLNPDGYWYCWDHGAPQPHHIGNYVPGWYLHDKATIQPITAPTGSVHQAGQHPTSNSWPPG